MIVPEEIIGNCHAKVLAGSSCLENLSLCVGDGGGGVSGGVACLDECLALWWNSEYCTL